MQHRRDIERCEGTGVVATLSELVALRRHARGIDLGAARRSGALLAGPYLSPFRGRGMDFDEVRSYQPGDDVRNIDWRVTARTGRPYSKVFHEERERPVWLLVDAGETMQFGTRRAFKSVAAAHTASLLAWAAREAGDRVGGLVSSAGTCVEIAPGRGDDHAYRLLGAIARATAPTDGPPAPPIATSLRRLRRAARAGSRVVVLSDFYDLDDEARRHLIGLARRCELACVLVFDALEVEAPPRGRYGISDGRGSAVVSCPGRGWRPWSEAFTARREMLRELCRQHRIQLFPLRTDDDPREVFSSHPPRCAAASHGRPS